MSRLPPALRTLLLHSGQTGALIGMAVLAMAMAPVTQPPDAEPAAPEDVPVIAVAVPAGPVMRSMTFGEPVPGFDINSRFGMRRLGGEPGVRMHKGVDIAAPSGTTVFAAAEGEVVRIGHDPAGYGNFIEMRHPNGMTTLYAHLKRIDVASGDRIAGRERIGLVGSTGYSTGPHLHFEIRRGGSQVNPARVLGQVFRVAVEGPGLAAAS
ncbi:peptidase M23 [Brevundimonas sp. LM2]|uniref:M23 family metallopeptidase n=1 Tax=Brevundimonas sp. LM2 TaxID=1938605 RepID=UPI000983AAD5|nr:M23 family metallopeptidase [Brevundimonas sp. LM2]AQR61715.1 peptidase M23 [Brevundimonas sp. LM2]